MARSLASISRRSVYGGIGICYVSNSSLKGNNMNDITNDLPNYLVFLILKDIKRLRELSPDHILVKAVEAAPVSYTHLTLPTILLV